MPIITLAKYTIKGYIKERILLVVLIFGFVPIPLFGILLIILLGAGSFHQEKEHGILKALLAKPITRADFVIGKWVGTVLTVVMVMLLMAVVYLFVMWLSGAEISANIFWAIYLAMFEIALVAAVLTFFSSFTSPVLTSFFTVCTAAAGHLSKDLLEFADQFTGAVPKFLAHAGYYLLPNLGLFNVREEAVHGLTLPDGFIGTVTIYGVLYTLTLLLLSAAVFKFKEIH